IALARSITDAGLQVPIYTYYGAYDGITATLGAAGKDKIYLVHQGVANHKLSDKWVRYNTKFKVENPKFDITVPRMIYAIEMLAKAIEQAQSTEPYDVALALENMKYTNMNGEELWMRPD